MATTNTADLAKLLEEITFPKTFKKGDIVEGEVISVDTAQMLVDVGARSEGVVLGKELKLEGEKLDKKPGDKVLVYVVRPENTEGQVELSIRRTGTARKWYDLKEAKEKDKTLEVMVIEANTGGVIVEIGGGLRGFVPSSQLRNNRIYNDNFFSNKNDATKKLQSKLAELIDEKLEVKVMEINEEQGKVILSEKMVYNQSDLEERNKTLENLKVGDTLTGRITGIAPFGLFVNAGGLEGLVHLSEISWDKVTNPADFYNIDDEVDVLVIGLQDDGKRVAYSIKKLTTDPWKNIISKYSVGQVVKGTVQRVVDYGAFIKISDGLNGLIHISELSNKLVKDPREIVKEGDDIEVMIISISDEDRHLGLSLKRLREPQASEAGTSKSTSESDEEAEESSEKVSDSETSSREMEGLDELLSESDEEKAA